jgi:retinol dehydrogenase-12
VTELARALADIVSGHYYFTTLLMPQLIAGAARSPEQSSRVVTLTSAGHVLFPRIEFDTLRDGPARDTLSKFDLYNQSKFVSGPSFLRTLMTHAFF